MRAAPAGPSSAASTSAARCLRVAHARPRWAFAFGRARPPRRREMVWPPAPGGGRVPRREASSRRAAEDGLGAHGRGIARDSRGVPRAHRPGRGLRPKAHGPRREQRRPRASSSRGGAVSPRAQPHPRRRRRRALRERADEIVVGLPVPPKPPDADAARKREGPRAPVDLSRVVGGGARPKVRFPEDVEASSDSAA